MNRSFFLQWRTVFCLFAAGILLPVSAAMNIVEYDKMVDGDRQAYLDFLVDTVREILMTHDWNDDAAKMCRLFHGSRKGEYLSEGEKLFNKNLDALRTRDAKRHYSNHNAPRVQVESALSCDSEGKQNNVDHGCHQGIAADEQPLQAKVSHREGARLIEPLSLLA